MPRRLLRDGRVVADDWTYLADAGGDGAAAAAGVESAADDALAAAADAAPGAVRIPSALILTFDQWSADKPRWLAAPGRLGVVLSPAHKVESLAPDLTRFALLGAEFPGPSEGRGYTQGRLLRERYGFRGELRAVGHVRRDQIFFLARCGFNSFELADGDLESASAAFSTFSAEYQPSNDLGLPLKLRRRPL
jgi:uncharacterized protein (DUF934 family)